MHWLMFYLFIGWGAFFIISLYKFRASKNKKADYYGVKSHLSSVLEGGVAIVEIIALFGFSYPIWAYRVNEVPDSRDAVNIRVIAQQFAWNIHYPGTDGKFGKTNIDLVVREKTQAQNILKDLKHINQIFYNDFRKGLFYWVDVFELIKVYLLLLNVIFIKCFLKKKKKKSNIILKFKNLKK